MAENDANRVGTPPPLVCSAGGVRLHGQTSSRKGLSQLPVGPAPPKDVLLHIHLLENEEEAQKLAQELHSATHLGGQALWKLFRDRYDFKSSCRICLEVTQSCPQCQMGSDYGHCQKTTGAIQSRGPWDTLSIDIVGPLPADHRHEFLIVFVDCYFRYTILVPSSNHTANTVREALLRHVVPYFGTPRQLLSDRGREFVGEIWGKLLRSLGVQRVLTPPPITLKEMPLMSVATGRSIICSMLARSKSLHLRRG